MDFRAQDFARDIHIAICRDNDEQPDETIAETLGTQLRLQSPESAILKNMRIGPQTAQFLQRRLEFAKITTLDLFGNRIGDQGLASILRLKVKRLNIGFNRLTNAGALLLAQYLGSNTNLEAIELGTGSDFVFGYQNQTQQSIINKIDPVGIIQLCRAVGQSKGLKYIGLGGLTILQTDGAQAVGQMIQNSALIGLDLSDTRLADQGAAYVLRGLSQNHGLKYLNIARNNITFLSMPLLGEAFQNGTELTDLDISGNILSADGARSIALGIAQNKFIQSINFQNCALDDNGVEIIARVLNGGIAEKLQATSDFYDMLQVLVAAEKRDNRPKEYIIQSHDGRTLRRGALQNVYQDFKQEEIIKTDAVPENNSESQTQICNLNFAQNHVGEKAIIQLSKYIIQLECPLQVIDLSSNALSTKSCFELASALSKGLIQTTQFNYLMNDLVFPLDFQAPFGVDNTFANQVGIQRIQSSAKNRSFQNKEFHSTLHTICLNKCHITDPGFAALVLVLSRLPDLTNLQIGYNFVSHKAEPFLHLFLKSKSLTTVSLTGNQIPHSIVLRVQQACRANRQRVTMNAPLKLREKIEQLQVVANELPLCADDHDFRQRSLRYCQDLVKQVQNQADEHADNEHRIINNTQDKLDQCQTQIQIILNDIAQTQEDIKKNEQRCLDEQRIHKDLLEKDQQQIQSTLQRIESLDLEVKQAAIQLDITKKQTQESISTIKEETLEMYYFVKSCTALIQEFVSVKEFGKKAARAANSQFSNRLSFTGDYNKLKSVVTRLQAVQKGQKVVKPEGYDYKTFEFDKKEKKKIKSGGKSGIKSGGNSTAKIVTKTQAVKALQKDQGKVQPFKTMDKGVGDKLMSALK
ncbi:NOD3_protein [Hexamita inflata]|uniref:Putative n=1 Tax=Hexamita inflata TaxID=28002 RepID=A0AA86NHK2_9EUKA|nr:NOD3 protein [Hexamita inflata]